ncbi:MAG: GTP-binding protein, partial [Phycisphaerales bacterium]|nr:GTP-binding protein [Phycisphaerales bacterium]
MAGTPTGDIRNLAVVGHSGAGKTSLCEAILHATGATNRLGSVADKTSHLDVDDEEKESGHSIDSHVMSVFHDGKLLNFIDTPGAPDFIGPAIASLAAAETAIIVVNAIGGIQVNTRRMREQAKNFGLGRVIVVNHMDAESEALDQLVKDIRESFGQVVAPVNLPANGGKAVINCIENDGGETDILSVESEHLNIVERVSECDDALMNKYFEEGTLSKEEIRANFVKAVKAGTIVPLLFTDSVHEVGIKELLNFIVRCCPSPLNGKQYVLKEGDKETPIDPEGDLFVGRVFKVAIDHKTKIKYPFIRVIAGHMKGDAHLCKPGDRKGLRPGHFHHFIGGAHKEVDEAAAGDIVAVAKLDLNIGDTLFASEHEGVVPMPKFPQPMYSLAITPKARGDEGKLGEAIHRFSDVDPCFKTMHDPQTHELVISGNGDMHLRVILHKMKTQFRIEVDTHPPKVPYRETITKEADGHHRHKKQTGGAGQFGEVYL